MKLQTRDSALREPVISAGSAVHERRRFFSQGNPVRALREGLVFKVLETG